MSARTILTIPVNFRDDPSQPRSLAQLKADSDVLAERVFGVHNTYGAVTVTSHVYDYVTLDMSKGCLNAGATLPALDTMELNQKIDAELAKRGQTRSGYTYVSIVSPTTFVKCSHASNFMYAFDYPLSVEEMASWLAWTKLGRGLSINWLCRAAAGSNVFVTLSAFGGPSPSTSHGRDFTSITGQGGGSLTAYDRNALGWLPASQQETLTTSGQRTIRRLESPAAGLKRLLLPAIGIEVCYHAKDTSIGWDWRGVTGHLINSSKRIDFTPDDKWLFGTTALAPGAPPFIYNGWSLRTLSIDAEVAVVELSTGAPPIDPPIDPPPTPVDCVVSAWSAWSACANGTQTRTRTVVTPAANGGAACTVLTETQACSPNPPQGGTVVITALTPADGHTIVRGQSVTMSVTQTGAARVEGHWLIGTQDNNKPVTRVGDTYSWTETPGGSPRQWYFLFRDASGKVIGKTEPARTVVVTP